MEINFKRFLSLLLALVMVIGMMPVGHAHASIADMTTDTPEAGKTYVICFKADNGDYYAMTSTYAAKNNHGVLLTERFAGTYNDAIGWTLVAADDNGGYYLNAADDGYGLSLNGTTSNDAFADARHPAEIMTLETSDDGYVIKNPSNRYVNALGAVAGGSSWGAAGNWTGGTTVYFFEIPAIEVNLTVGEDYKITGLAADPSLTGNDAVGVKATFVQSTDKNYQLTANIIDDGVYIIYNTRSNKWVLNTSVEGETKLQSIAGAPDVDNNAFLWKVSKAEGDNMYTLGDMSGNYLNLPGHEQAELVSDETATVKITGSPLYANAWEIFDTNTYMNDLGSAVGSYIGKEDGGSQWVFYKVTNVPVYTYTGVEALGSDAAITSGNKYLLVNIRNGNKTLLNQQKPGATSYLYLDGTTAAPSINAVWTITEHEGSYYIQDQNGNFLTFSSSAATVTYVPTPVSIGWQSFGSHGDAWGITRTVNNRKEYMSNPGGGSTNQGGGWHEENDGGSRWQIYTTSATPVGTYDVTVTAKAVGDTTVRIGNAIYTFHVTTNHVHNFVGSVTTPATCTTTGTMTYNCECGKDSYTGDIAIDSNNHVNTVEVPGTPATLNAPGVADAVFCNDCQTTVSGGEPIPQLTAKNAKVLSDNRVIALSESEYLLTSTGEGTWSLSHAGTYYVKPSANGNSHPQSANVFDQLTLTANGKAIWIASTQTSTNTAGGGSIHIYNNNAVPTWDRCSSAHGDGNKGTHDLYFFIANTDGTGDEIPGYTMVTKDGLVSGNSYLIAFKNSSNEWFIMNPSTKDNDHVAKLVTDAVNHTHEYTVETVTRAATCTTTGLKDLSCSCGHYHSEHKNVEIPATGEHTWGEGAITTNPGCESEGTKTYTCSVCNDTKTEPVAATGHTAGEAFNDNVVAATCGKDGSHDVVTKCTVCNTELSRENVIDKATGNHTWNDATCTAPKTCETCGATEGNALGHSYNAVVTAPDCVNDGYTTYTCACGDSYVADETTALGHKYESEYTAPDFGKDGYTTYTCSVCGDSYVETDKGTAKVAVAEVGGVKYATLAEAVTAAEAVVSEVPETVTLLADVELTERLTIARAYGISLNLNGYTISGKFDDAFGMIYVKKGATLTFAGTGIIDASESTSCAIGNYGWVMAMMPANVTIKGGNHPTYGEQPGVYNFYYDAETYGFATFASGYVIDKIWNCGYLSIDGATVDYLDNSGSLNVMGGTINELIARDGSDAPAVDGAGTITIANPDSITVFDEDYKLEEIQTGVYKVVPKTYVAEANGTKYESLAEAVEKAAIGDTVKLLGNATGAGVVINKDITIDLGGYIYTFNKTVGSAGTTTLGFQIIEGNNVTIKNGTLTSTAVTEGKEVKVLIQNYANLTLTDVELVDNTEHILYALSNNSGEVVLDGTTSITTDAVAFDVCKYASYAAPVVTVNTTGTIDGIIEVTGGELALEAATVNGALTYTAGKVTKAETVALDAPADYEWVDGVLTAKTYVAEVNGTKYESLAEAVEKAADGATVTLLGNATGAGVVIDKDITIDLGTYTYTFNKTVGSAGTTTLGFQIIEGNNVTIKNGTLTSTAVTEGKEVKVLIQNYANLTLTDVELVDNTEHILYALSNNSGEVVLDGTTSITTDAVAFDVCKYASYAAPVVTVNTTGTIDGNIEVTGGELALEAATVNGALTYTAGKVTKAETVKLDAPEDYKWADNGELVEAGLSGSGTQEDPFMITNLEELILFRDSVNAGETVYNADGVYVALGANIDMAGVNWSVNIGDDCNATFDGIFDGKNFTISNLNSTETAAKADGYVCAGLFGAIYGNAVVKNLTIENANINTGEFEGNNAAVVVGFAYDCTGSVENVTVKNSTINATGITGTGAIVGYKYYGSKLNVINCSVENTDITGEAYVGGIIGYAGPNCSIVDCSVKDATINATSCAAGGIAGIIVESGNITGASVKNAKLTSAHQNWQNAAGAVVGTITHRVTVTAECEEITINGAESNTLVGSVHTDKPANPVAKIQARIGNTYYTTLAEAVKAAKANDTITLLQPVEVTADTTYEIPANVTVESAGDAFVVSKGATLTLNGDGTVKAGTSGVGSWCAVFADGGNVVINGGTYSVGGDSSTTDTTHQNDVIYTKNGGTAVINGGTFLNDGTVWTLNENDSNRGTITVYGGSFQNWNPANNVAEGANTSFVPADYCSYEETTNTWTVVKGHTPAEAVKENEVAPTLNSTGSYESVVKCAKCGTELSRETVTVPALTGAVAEIDGYKYATFEAALEAAEAGDTIVLLKEVTVTADTTYDLTGITVESAGDAFVVTSGTLTLNGDGTVKAGTSGVGSWCAVFANGGNVVINGGTYSVGGDSSTTDTTHQNDVIYTKNGGTAVINGGTFLNDGTVWTLNENDSNRGTITVYGGSFQNWNPANNVAEGANTSFVPADYCSYEETTNTWTVVKGHTPAEAVKENEKDATCTVDGSYDSVVYCSACDEELSRETNTVTATGHTAGEAVKENEKPATCGADGSYESVTYCSECDTELDRETIPVSATGNHTAGEPVKEKETETGYDLVVKCSVCGTEMSRETITNPVETAKVTMHQMNAILESEILMEYTVAIPEELINAGAYVVLTKDGRWGEVTKEYKGAELAACLKDGIYAVTIGVASGEMTSDITIQVFDGEGKELNLYNKSGKDLGTSATRTVVDFARSVLNNPSSTQERRNLAIALVTYGGYAQKNFSVNAENPAYNLLDNLGIAQLDLNAVTAETVKDYKNNQTNTGMGVKARKIEAVLDSYISYRVYLTVEGDISSYTFSVTTPEGERQLQYMNDAEDGYYVEIPEIASGYIDYTYKVTVTNAQGESNEITTSVLSYVRAVLSNSSNPQEKIDLAKALYLYNQAANAYFGR